MRHVIYFLVSLIIAVSAAFFLREMLVVNRDPGYVLIGYRHWALETSLFVFGLAILAAFVVFYFAIRMIRGFTKLPDTIKKKGMQIKDQKSQRALIAGLVDSAEGNWERAERVLIRHASDSGVPLIHYLTAAKAAHSRGAVEKRDEYLRMASESDPNAQIAVGLTQAELHLSQKQFNQALESLTRLKSIAPGHASVLRMLHQTYAQLEDWEGVRKLIPALNKNKVLMEAEIKLLETETFSALLKQKAEERDPEALKSLWETIPEHIQHMSGIEPLYYAAMIEADAGNEVEQALRSTLEREWNPTLLVLYGCIRSADGAAQIEAAESWLEGHPRDAVLLRVLGKLTFLQGDKEKAERYLGTSVGIEPSVEAYQMLGDLFMGEGDANKASECYRRGLELASSEVIKQVEDISPDYLAGLEADTAPQPVSASAN